MARWYNRMFLTTWQITADADEYLDRPRDRAVIMDYYRI
jgi:hypothetical protein